MSKRRVIKMEYTKINTLWKREVKDGKPTGKILEGEYSKEEFKNIKNWHVTEKIDGTNVRIIYTENLFHVSYTVEIKGKTDDAQMNLKLVDFLNKTFTVDKLKPIFRKGNEEKINVILYGEGYGPNVQKGGGRYRNDVSFILFDVWIDGWWLEPKNVKDIAQKLGIDYVPELGIMTIDEIVSLVKSGFKSKISKDTTLDAEGIVARSYPLVLFRDGKPLIFKLKKRDYQ